MIGYTYSTCTVHLHVIKDNTVPYTRIFSSDKNFEGLNYVGINFRGLRTAC